jgi:metallo-beta-lactamase family protein
MALTLGFYGGADTVTGSNFLVEGARGKMLVDCGIEQGRDFVEKEMYAPFPYDVPSLNALVITHTRIWTILAVRRSSCAKASKALSM